MLVLISVVWSLLRIPQEKIVVSLFSFFFTFQMNTRIFFSQKLKSSSISNAGSRFEQFCVAAKGAWTATTSSPRNLLRSIKKWRNPTIPDPQAGPGDGVGTVGVGTVVSASLSP